MVMQTLKQEVHRADRAGIYLRRMLNYEGRRQRCRAFGLRFENELPDFMTGCVAGRNPPVVLRAIYIRRGSGGCSVRSSALLEVLSNRLSYLEPMQPPYPDQSETEQK